MQAHLKTILAAMSLSAMVAMGLSAQAANLTFDCLDKLDLNSAISWNVGHETAAIYFGPHVGGPRSAQQIQALIAIDASTSSLEVLSRAGLARVPVAGLMEPSAFYLRIPTDVQGLQSIGVLLEVADHQIVSYSMDETSDGYGIDDEPDDSTSSEVELGPVRVLNLRAHPAEKVSVISNLLERAFQATLKLKYRMGNVVGACQPVPGVAGRVTK